MLGVARCSAKLHVRLHFISIQVLQDAETLFQYFLAHPWHEVQRHFGCLQQDTVDMKQQHAVLGSVGGSTSPPSIKTVVSLAEKISTENLAQSEVKELRSDSNASVANVKATVGNKSQSNQTKHCVVWRLPYIVTEAQAMVLRKVATLAFRLDRQKEVELVLRVALS